MKLGTEDKKKVYALVVLGVVAAILRVLQLFCPIPRPPPRRNRRPLRSGSALARRRWAAPLAPVPAPLPTAQPDAPRGGW